MFAMVFAVGMAATYVTWTSRRPINELQIRFETVATAGASETVVPDFSDVFARPKYAAQFAARLLSLLQAESPETVAAIGSALGVAYGGELADGSLERNLAASLYRWFAGARGDGTRIGGRLGVLQDESGDLAVLLTVDLREGLEKLAIALGRALWDVAASYLQEKYAMQSDARERHLARMEQNLAEIGARYDSVSAEVASERRRLEDLLRALHDRVAALEARAGRPPQTRPLLALDPIWADPYAALDPSAFSISVAGITDPALAERIHPLVHGASVTPAEGQELEQMIAMAFSERMRFTAKYASLFRELCGHKLARQKAIDAGMARPSILRKLRSMDGTDYPVFKLGRARHFSGKLFLVEGFLASIALGILAAMLAEIVSRTMFARASSSAESA